MKNNMMNNHIMILPILYFIIHSDCPAVSIENASRGTSTPQTGRKNWMGRGGGELV
jgi:hypothetical protein